MRSRLSFIIVACLAVVSTLAASGCASNSANANGANAAPSSAASTTTQTTTTQTTTAEQSAAAQSNAQGASANNATAGQSASTTNAGGATTANASGAGREVDACALLTSDDIKSVQGEAVKESKPSRHDDSSLRTSQCFFTTATFNKSVSLEVTTSADGRSARRFWDERFERAREEAGKGEKEREREKREREKKERDADKKAGARGEEDEEGALPTAIKGIGDEAYWAASRVNGTLYARRGDSFVRVSVGGNDPDAERLRKAKALAQKALSRM